MNRILGWLLSEKPRSNPCLSLYFFVVVWGLSGRFEIASLRDAGVRSYSLPQTAEPRGCTPSVPCLGLSRFSLSEAVEEFPGSLYILTVVWGLSGRFEIASPRDAGVRLFSLTPDCRAEGCNPSVPCLGLSRFSLSEAVSPKSVLEYNYSKSPTENMFVYQCLCY